MASLQYETSEQWHELRKRHIGGSEIAALFNMSPYGLTRWQLYQMKRGALPETDFSGNTQVSRGKHYEPAIAAYAQEKFGIQLRKVRRYLVSDDTPGYGASLDYEMFGDGQLVPTEIKLSNFSGDWDWDGDEITNVPDGFMLQLQHQIGTGNFQMGQIIADVGYDVRRILVPRSEKIIAAIKDAVKTFWAEVDTGNEPPVDFSADADAISRLAYLKNLRSIELTAEDAPLFETYTKAAADAKDAESRKDAARAELLKKILDAGEGNDGKTQAVCGAWKMSVARIQDNPGRQIKAEDVGQFIGARKGYVRCTVSQAKK